MKRKGQTPNFNQQKNQNQSPQTGNNPGNSNGNAGNSNEDQQKKKRGKKGGKKFNNSPNEQGHSAIVSAAFTALPPSRPPPPRTQTTVAAITNKGIQSRIAQVDTPVNVSTGQPSYYPSYQHARDLADAIGVPKTARYLKPLERPLIERILDPRKKQKNVAKLLQELNTSEDVGEGSSTGPGTLASRISDGPELEEGPPAKKARVDDDLFSGDNDDDAVSLMDQEELDDFIAHTAGFSEYVSQSSALLANTHGLQHYVNYVPLMLVPATTLPTSLNISGSAHTHESVETCSECKGKSKFDENSIWWMADSGASLTITPYQTDLISMQMLEHPIIVQTASKSTQLQI